MGRIPKATREKAVKIFNSQRDSGNKKEPLDKDEEDEVKSLNESSMSSNEQFSKESVCPDDDLRAGQNIENNVVEDSNKMSTIPTEIQSNTVLTPPVSESELLAETDSVLPKPSSYILTFLNLIEKQPKDASVKLIDLSQVFPTSGVISVSFQPGGIVYKAMFNSFNQSILKSYKETTVDYEGKYALVKKELAEDRGRVAARIAAINKQEAATVFKELLLVMPRNLEHAVRFGKETPVISQLNSPDYAKIIELKHFHFFIIATSMFYMDGESYVFLNNGQTAFTRYWISAVRRKAEVDLMFEFTEMLNRLNLTRTEKALLAAVVLTTPGWNFDSLIN
jgi:hypothetical protein